MIGYLSPSQRLLRRGFLCMEMFFKRNFVLPKHFARLIRVKGVKHMHKDYSKEVNDMTLFEKMKAIFAPKAHGETRVTGAHEIGTRIRRQEKDLGIWF